MSTANISYSSMKDAAGEAMSVARKLDSYANGLNNNVYKKLVSYSGSHTANIQTAQQYVKNKVTELEEKSDAFTTYSNDLGDLRDECQNTDKAVRTMVSQLTGAFKKNNGIKDSKVQNTINYLLTSFVNTTCIGRWLSNTKEKGESIKEHIKQSISTWWNYEGGKQLVTGGLIGIGEVVMGVCTVIGAIFALVAAGTVGAVIVAVAALIGGVIALVNGIANVVNESRGYYETKHNEDPALGKRRSGEDTLQDALRRETDSKFWHNVATGIDATKFVCDVIGFVDSIGTLAKNAYKWTTGSMADIKNLRVKDILTKDNFRQFGIKLKDTALGGWREIKTAFQIKDFTVIKEFVTDTGTDFMNNLKKGYGTWDSLKSGAKTLKKITAIPTALLKDGFTVKNVVWNIGILTVVLPNINTGQLITYTGGHGGGALDYDISAMHITDVTGAITGFKSLVKKGIAIEKNIKDVNFNSSTYSIDLTSIDTLLNKMSGSSSFSIAVPDIAIPDIHLPKKQYAYA